MQSQEWTEWPHGKVLSWDPGMNGPMKARPFAKRNWWICWTALEWDEDDYVRTNIRNNEKSIAVMDVHQCANTFKTLIWHIFQRSCWHCFCFWLTACVRKGSLGLALSWVTASTAASPSRHDLDLVLTTCARATFTCQGASTKNWHQIACRMQI